MSSKEIDRILARAWRHTRRAVVAGGLASLAMATSALAAGKVTEEDVVVPTPDGSAEAALFHPAVQGKWPAVLFWPDFVGLRPAFRDMARKLAAEGFVVLVPNTFYRSMRPNDAELNPWDPEVRPVLSKYRAEATDDGIARDVTAYLAFLDGLKQTDRKKKAGTLGYDLGGSYAFRAAAAAPGRIAAVGSIYGLGVATAHPNSPHLLVPKTKATYYVAIAKDDEAREPEDKDDIRKAIAEGGLEGTVEVYEAGHGWANPAAKSYDPASTEKAFQAIVALFKAKLR